MNNYHEEMLKGKMSEIIAEEMLREMGFYVIRFGQEHSVPPIVQLEHFVKWCGGNFNIDRSEYTCLDREFLSQLPDFVVVDKKGGIYLVEVKFSKKATLNFKQVSRLLSIPTCCILVVNLEVGDKLAFDPEDSTKFEPIREELKNARFHVWIRELDAEENDDEEGVLHTTTLTLSEWLEHEFEIKHDDIIKKYEALVNKWYAPCLSK